MRYRLLGKSGLRVSELCLGTMTFGEGLGWGASKDESRRMFVTYVEAGGNFLDTANGYTGGNSERFLGEFVRGQRERFVIATKYSFNMRRGDPNAGGNHRKNMVQAVEASLQRLGIDYIDLYWVHAWDRLTPIEEVMRGLDDLVRQGKILYVGASNLPAWLVSYGNAVAELRGWTPFIALQIEYSLIQRTPEREFISMARMFGLGVTAWSPLAGGLLTGKYSADGKAGDGARRLDKTNFYELNDRNLKIAAEVEKVSRESGRSPAQIALAWVLHKGALPILGARTQPQLVDNLKCLNVVLTPEQLARLDETSAIRLGYPHEFLQRHSVLDDLHGGMYEQILQSR